ncbi:hypothetical protein MKX01_034069 [Papaver californicum]|nr:hypothetical protein MKX01_034069 [Papaver californicum]
MFIFSRTRRKSNLNFHQKLTFLNVILLFSLTSSSFSLPCDDIRCKTKSCNENGTCICNLPDPSTILNGNRQFLGGKFCDEEVTMCDGTNSFWCRNGGICNELIHGEKYTCKCDPSYSGEHCEYRGAPCGKIYCFHLAQCLFEVEGDVCDCPPNWKGSVDCSLPTTTHTDSSVTTSTTIQRLPREEDGHSSKWFVFFFVVSFASGAAAGAVMYLKKFFSKNDKDTRKFQQLSQIQACDLLDDDDDGSFAPHVAYNDDDAHR